MEHSLTQSKPCMTRRDFLLFGGKAAATTMVVLSLPGFADAQEVPARLTKYPRKQVAKLGEIEQDAPIYFRYPFDEDPLYSTSMLVKLGEPAGGGVGPDKDIVAFNTLCTHMGGPMQGTYKAEYKALGPCPFHLTSFDLTRHGIVIAGHATESLPQVTLEVEGDTIYATGIMGLVYGRANNLVR
jgi:arsenite oxidase small subunit